jgi:sec-independent protein translocase protein TatA
MGSLGMPELIVILLIVVLVFGAGKLPQIGENLGKAIRNFKGATEREKIEETSKKPEEIASSGFFLELLLLEYNEKGDVCSQDRIYWLSWRLP